jgi:arylsulfatase A-like enzyme
MGEQSCGDPTFDVAVAFSTTGGAFAFVRQGVQKPNVILIVADDMRANDFEYTSQTRQLLTETGFAFPNTCVTHSLCCPSRASILRCQYTHNHQVINNTMSERGFQRFRDEGHEDSTVATWLKNDGYRIVLLGKYLNHYGVDDPRYVPPGWDKWYGKANGLPGDG